jgi:DNA-binding YbaB/EbfC family protein
MRPSPAKERTMFDEFKNLNLGNLGDIMRRAQEMQGKMKQVQDELGRKQITADAGGGMVQATVNGKLELVKLKIDRARIDPNDTEMLEDVIVAAVSAAQSRAMQTVQQEMQKVAGEMGLPPGMLPGS